MTIGVTLDEAFAPALGDELGKLLEDAVSS
jgi:hypothetical protein